MAKKSISIYDIAQIAGVSTATVSKVLNGKGSISQATRDRVLAIARDQGYVGSFTARALREGSTRTVGIVVPDISNSFYSSIVLDVETRLYDAGYTCYICDSHNDVQRTERNLTSLVQRQVDGLILVNGRKPAEDAIPEGLPVVGIDCPYEVTSPWRADMRTDFSKMIEDATCTLIAHGCQRIALITVFSGARRDDYETPNVTPFRQALKKKGLRLDRNLILNGPHLRESRLEAEELVAECLDAGYAPDGIVALGDRAALGACTALEAHGLVVGRDVKVIGTDDTLYARIARPALSSVNRHVEQMSERGVQALLAMMAGERPAQTQIVIPHEVVERSSTLG